MLEWVFQRSGSLWGPYSRTLVFILLTGMLLSRLSLAQPIPLPTMHSVSEGQAFQTAKLPSTEVEGVLKQVEKTSFDYPDSWQAELRVRRVSLGDADGLIVGGTNLLCGGTGNCQTWVFRRSNGIWKAMFEQQVPIVSAFGFSNERSRGIKNLVTIAHVSA